MFFKDFIYICNEEKVHGKTKKLKSADSYCSLISFQLWTLLLIRIQTSKNSENRKYQSIMLLKKKILQEEGNCFPSRAPGFIPFFCGICVAHLFTFLCYPIMCLYVLTSVLLCPLCFPHKNDVRVVFTSSCLSEGSCLICVIFICLHIVVSNTYCVACFFLLVVIFCLVYPVLPMSLNCPFLIVPPVFFSFNLQNMWLININTVIVIS